MSKELEALERLKTAPSFMGGTAEYQFCTKSETLLMQDYETVKQALQRLESIDNANPSEALNVLKATEKYTGIDLTAVKNALIKAQKEHKALEVLKKIIDFDLVEIGSRKVCIYSDDDNGDVVKMISEEEFNVLEEVL